MALFGGKKDDQILEALNELANYIKQAIPAGQADAAPAAPEPAATNDENNAALIVEPEAGQGGEPAADTAKPADTSKEKANEPLAPANVGQGGQPATQSEPAPAPKPLTDLIRTESDPKDSIIDGLKARVDALEKEVKNKDGEIEQVLAALKDDFGDIDTTTVGRKENQPDYGAAPEEDIMQFMRSFDGRN